MSQSIYKVPVQDSVPKVNNEVAVGEDIVFQRRWWRFENGVLILYAVIVILDLLGAFGRGVLAKANMGGNDAGITVRYERIERTGTPSMLEVEFAPSAIQDNKIQLWVSESLVTKMGNQKIAPQPLTSTVGQGGILYTLPATTTPASIEFALQPTAPGVFRVAFRVPGLPLLSTKIYVVP